MRITESQLRQLIRKSLLTEAAKRPEDLPSDVGVFASISPSGGSVQYVRPQNKVSPVGGKIFWRSNLGANKPYVIQQTYDTTSGYGPMLYDIALELCGARGLMPDRDEVSAEARSVWNYYMNSRPDVRKVQMDNPSNELTPVTDDNVEQSSAEQDGAVKKWMDSPLSKAYIKDNTSTIDRLKALGKWYTYDEVY